MNDSWSVGSTPLTACRALPASASAHCHCRLNATAGGAAISGSETCFTCSRVGRCDGPHVCASTPTSLPAHPSVASFLGQRRHPSALHDEGLREHAVGNRHDASRTFELGGQALFLAGQVGQGPITSHPDRTPGRSVK
jgi:hypothetical protein